MKTAPEALHAQEYVDGFVGTSELLPFPIDGTNVTLERNPRVT